MDTSCDAPQLITTEKKGFRHRWDCHGVGCHRNDRNLLAGVAFLFSNYVGRLQPVHAWHLNIHQHPIKILTLKEINSFVSVSGYRHLMFPSRDQDDEKLIIQLAIFDQEDLQRLTGDDTSDDGRSISGSAGDSYRLAKLAVN